MMEPYAIHDLHIRPLRRVQRQKGTTLELVRFSDHLLRRFGMAEVVFLAAGEALPAMTRQVADEVWALVEGSVQFNWLDKRQSSPSNGEAFDLNCAEPTLVLVPFGVEFRAQAIGGPAQLVRFATHEGEE